jgi:thiol-disulfide isomerase/thioredoxin
MQPRRLKLSARAGLVSLLLLAGGLAVADPVQNLRVEPYRIATLTQGDITPDTQRGRVLVVNLWATWCVPCRTEMPEIEAFFRKYQARGVEVIAVSLDDRRQVAAVRQVMAAYSFPAALAVDSDIRALGRVRRLPATFVIDLSILEQAVLPLLAPPAR